MRPTSTPGPLCTRIYQPRTRQTERTRKEAWAEARIQETARHAGYADTLRERIDGATGR
jgi:hypothetical protein